MEPGKRYEMLWDCGFCGTAGNLALTHRCCPACGAPQDPTRRYYPAAEHAVAVEDHPFVGADVTCPACGAPSARGPAHCGRCGAALDGAAEVARRDAQSAGASGFTPDDAAAARSEHAAARAAREQALSTGARAVASGRAPRRWSLGVVIAVLAVLAALGCGGLLAVVLWTRPVEVVVVGHAWARELDVESLRTVQDEAWRGALPAGVRGVVCHREQRSTRDVPDGETCVDERVDLGDGTFTVEQRCTTRYRAEPVFDERCTFEVDRWVVTDTRVVSGDDRTPRSPDETLTRSGACLGCERLGSRRERYELVVRDPEGTLHRCPIDEARWSKLDAGTRLVAEEGAITGAFACGELAPP